MIKNWIVKTKQIKQGEKGFLNHVNYLTDNNKASHEYSAIKVLNNGAKNIIKEIDKRKSYRNAHGLSGGGVRNFSTSMVLSLPRDIKQPTTKEWEKIGLYTIKEIAKKNNIDFEKLKNVSHIVLHNESASPSKPSHLHILISNVLDVDVIKGISQKKTTFTAKKAFNYAVKKLLNEDNNQYLPVNTKTKNKPLFVVRAEKAEKVMLLFKSFKNDINDWFSEIINKRNSFILSTLAKKAAQSFNDFDNSIENKNNNLPDKVLTAVETIEDLTADNETVELLALPTGQEHIEPTKETEKVSTKTTRKRRRRTPKPTNE
ncbi:hypothetical protein [Litorilituus lipolyticus]|uniref:Uncharacterized protein n=1 Tax=Litorilituus lipolyticus TaxID=2491017 RepID=A0A502KRY8_9GAMM|nr:hypothetical protein [Litorilituus lipolyticus]TPH12781.1 hypothetical protein EPA86_15230 [Litorilituus lipolyticus]